MVNTLKGNEIVYVQGVQPNGQGGAIEFPVSVQQIAALANSENTGLVNTPITTVGNGTLTAAGLVEGLITRTGPTANYTDTTDTAANIVAAMPEFLAGATFLIRLKNGTAFTQTLSAAAGVTLPATVIVPAFSTYNAFATIGGTAASPTVVITHLSTVPISVGISDTVPTLGALNTVGAGTLTAALIAGGLTARGGAQSATAFADTTDTAANIIAACPQLVNKIGTAMMFTYQNTTNAPATLGGGTGVTVSGTTVIPANSSVTYLVSYTAAATITMVGLGVQYNPQSGTFVCNGVTPVTVNNTAVSPNSQINVTLKTVGGTVGALPAVKTITPGTGFTIAGTASDTSTYNYTILG